MINNGPVPQPLDERWLVRYPDDPQATFLDTFSDEIARAIDAGKSVTAEDARILAAYDRLFDGETKRKAA